MSRLLPLTLFLVLCCLASATGAEAKPILGIADQKPSTFADARLAALGLRHARIAIPWDVMADPASLRVADDWMRAARSAAVEPLVAFTGSRRRAFKGRNPTNGQMVAALRSWRARWPGQVRVVSTWNEPNLGKRPEVVASWWRALTRAARRSPNVWGLHAYNDVNTFSTRRTKALLARLRGDVWITETGGVVDRARPMYRFSGCGVAHQTRATRFLLRRIARLSPRIKRIYVYHWGLGDPARASFDAALIGPDGRERPSLGLIRSYLGLPAPVPAGGYSGEPARCNRGTTIRR